MAQLNKNDVLTILQLLEEGQPIARIAKSLGVTEQVVYRIKIGATWSHITGIHRGSKKGKW